MFPLELPKEILARQGTTTRLGTSIWGHLHRGSRNQGSLAEDVLASSEYSSVHHAWDVEGAHLPRSSHNAPLLLRRPTAPRPDLDHLRMLSHTTISRGFGLRLRRPSPEAYGGSRVPELSQLWSMPGRPAMSVPPAIRPQDCLAT
jgi:hypothetical protein